MTPQEMVWFNALVKDREENARILAKDSMAGYRQSLSYLRMIQITTMESQGRCWML